MADLTITSKQNDTYYYRNVSNIRESKKELRWTSARGVKDQMALVFIKEYKVK